MSTRSRASTVPLESGKGPPGLRAASIAVRESTAKTGAKMPKVLAKIVPLGGISLTQAPAPRKTASVSTHRPKDRAPHAFLTLDTPTPAPTPTSQVVQSESTPVPLAPPPHAPHALRAHTRPPREFRHVQIARQELNAPSPEDRHAMCAGRGSSPTTLDLQREFVYLSGRPRTPWPRRDLEGVPGCDCDGRMRSWVANKDPLSLANIPLTLFFSLSPPPLTPHSCSNCPSGTFSDSTGSPVCTSCSAGTYSEAMASSCTNCGVGTYSAMAASVCVDCNHTLGFVNGDEAQSVCEYCGAGKKADGESNSCEDCAPGKISLGGSGECTSCTQVSEVSERGER